MPAYEVTTLVPPGPPPFGWTGKMLEQARKHNEPISYSEYPDMELFCNIFTHITRHSEEFLIYSSIVIILFTLLDQDMK